MMAVACDGLSGQICPGAQWREARAESQPDAKRCNPSQLVAGGRYELYSNYPLKIQAVTASLAMSNEVPRGCSCPG